LIGALLPWVQFFSLLERLRDLADLVAGTVPGRTDSDAISLFYSIGLAGTEVIAAATIVAAARADGFRAEP
jgi:ornithine cyclodeaminase/alanine dehydrogenase-like protein (mu-crystallin family)